MKKIKVVMKFKVTASKKWKCRKCKKNLHGEEGFIDVNRFGQYMWEDMNIKTCWDCFKNTLKDIREDRKKRKKRFSRLLKINIIRHLK